MIKTYRVKLCEAQKLKAASMAICRIWQRQLLSGGRKRTRGFLKDKRISDLEQSVKELKELHKDQHQHALDYQKFESSAAKALDREDILALR